MTENTLKSCPFCGGEAQFHTDNGPTGECYGWVGCNQCDAMSLHCDIRSMQPEDRHPIDAWNTRTENTSATEPVAWMRMNKARTASTGVTDVPYYRDLWQSEGDEIVPLYALPPAPEAGQ